MKHHTPEVLLYIGSKIIQAQNIQSHVIHENFVELFNVLFSVV